MPPVNFPSTSGQLPLSSPRCDQLFTPVLTDCTFFVPQTVPSGNPPLRCLYVLCNSQKNDSSHKKCTFGPKCILGAKIHFGPKRALSGSGRARRRFWLRGIVLRAFSKGRFLLKIAFSHQITFCAKNAFRARNALFGAKGACGSENGLCGFSTEMAPFGICFNRVWRKTQKV